MSKNLARQRWSMVLILGGIIWLAAASTVYSQTPQHVDRLLSSWQMEEARQSLDELSSRLPDSADVLYLDARYDFYRGNYGTARGKLEQLIANHGARPDFEQLRQLVAATENVTKDYEKHISPDGKFEIFIPPGPDQVLLPYAFEALDRAYDTIGKELDYYPPIPIRVEIYPRTAVLAEVSALTEEEIRTSGTIALCMHNRLMITSPSALLRGYGWVDTLVHEYVHYVINRKASNNVPIWMHEGLAKYLERHWRGSDANRLEPSSENLLRQRVKSEDLIPFEAMHPSMAKLPSQEDAAVAFAEVYTAMEYLREKVGPKAFSMLLERIRAGDDAQTAFAHVLDMTFDAFEQDWMRYLRQRPMVELPDKELYAERLVFHEERDAQSEIEQIQQPRARDHIHLGEMLQARERYAAAVVQYHKAVSLIGSKNPILQTRLAQSLRKTQQPHQALEALDTIQHLYPSYVTTWLELGKASLELDDAESAQGFLLEAAWINPFDPDVHEYLAQAYEKLGYAELAQRERNFAQMLRK